MTDRRFGVHKFGDGSLFGPSDATSTLSYGVEIDWDGDGLFDGTNEADRMVSWSSFRGRQNLLRPNGAGFENVQTGTLTIVLDNSDDRYTSMNASSPLYPNVEEGKEVRFRVRDMSGSVSSYPVFYGRIDDIQTQGRFCTLKIEDTWRVLRTGPSTVKVYQNITPDTAAGYILDSISWPTRWGRDFDTFADIIPYWWASGNSTAAEELENLASSFLSFFCIDASGQAKFISRTTVGASAANYFQEEILKDFNNRQSGKNRYNVMRIKTHPRTQATTGTIYQQTGTAPSIAAGATLTLFVDYKYNNINCPAINIIAPVATTDYTANTLANGTGTDKTSNVSVTLTDFGDTAKIVIVNSDASTVYMTLLKVRGDAIYEASSADITYPTNLDSVVLKKQFLLDLKNQQDINAAISFAGVYGPFLDQQNLFPAIKIENRPTLQYPPDLFDVVSLTVTQKGIDGLSFRVGGIQHQSDASIKTCQRVTTTIFLEPYISSASFWVWDTASVFDTSTIFGY